jgi:hypothetical protein
MAGDNAGSITVVLNAVIVAVTRDSPRILTVRDIDQSTETGQKLVALPYGPLHVEKDRTLERGVRGWVSERTGLELGYVEQLYTFGDRNRDPSERQGGPRVISVAYLALVRENLISRTGRAEWVDCYSFLPWEDWREGSPQMIRSEVNPLLEEWVNSAGDRVTHQNRSDRVAITFGIGGAEWDGEKVLERYELLYEAGLVGESARDLPGRVGEEASHKSATGLGYRMALDHRRMVATALGRLRGKIKYRPVVFELLAPTFTLFQLQRVVEALAGVRLHKQNFRRLVERGGLVEGTGRLDTHTGGRPAELFRFRKEVFREHRAPGVGIPGSL